jgi:hypothetical protein
MIVPLGLTPLLLGRRASLVDARAVDAGRAAART